MPKRRNLSQCSQPPVRKCSELCCQDACTQAVQHWLTAKHASDIICSLHVKSQQPKCDCEEDQTTRSIWHTLKFPNIAIRAREVFLVFQRIILVYPTPCPYCLSILTAPTPYALPSPCSPRSPAPQPGPSFSGQHPYPLPSTQLFDSAHPAPHLAHPRPDAQPPTPHPLPPTA